MKKAYVLGPKKREIFYKVILHPRGVFLYRLEDLDDVMKS